MEPSELKKRARELRGSEIYVVYWNHNGYLSVRHGNFLSFIGSYVRLETQSGRYRIAAYRVQAAFLASPEAKNEG